MADLCPHCEGEMDDFGGVHLRSCPLALSTPDQKVRVELTREQAEVLRRRCVHDAGCMTETADFDRDKVCNCGLDDALATLTVSTPAEKPVDHREEAENELSMAVEAKTGTDALAFTACAQVHASLAIADELRGIREALEAGATAPDSEGIAVPYLRPASKAHLSLTVAVLRCLETGVEPDTVRRFIDEELLAVALSQCDEVNDA